MEKKVGPMKKVVIIPGWTYSTDKWERFSEELEKAGTEVTILKVPGLIEQSDKVWDLSSYTQWLKEKLKKDPKIVLVGHSNGGRIAIAYAAENPDKLSKLVLVDSAGIFHNEFPIRIKRTVFRKLSGIGKKIDFLKNFRWILYKFAREHDYEKAGSNMRETMKNLIYKDLTPLMRKIKIPTLILWGENDTITPLSDGKLMTNLIKGAKLFVVRGAKHAPFYTHPRQTLKILLNNL